jgi:hypothetical protein
MTCPDVELDIVAGGQEASTRIEPRAEMVKVRLFGSTAVSVAWPVAPANPRVPPVNVIAPLPEKGGMPVGEVKVRL